VRGVAATWLGKAIAAACRLSGRGGGTALPGLLALRLCPDLDARLARGLRRGCALITGTNGKTTTAKMAATVLRSAGWRVVRNAGGSNLRRGVASALIDSASLAARVSADLGLFEADEGALPELVRVLRPRVVVLTNFFRDQLDRYGELATTAKRIARSVAEFLGPESTLILNYDDPLVASVGEGARCAVVGFGLDCPEAATDAPQRAADSKDCERCGVAYDYAQRYFAHLGDYRCPSCGRARPALDYAVRRVRTVGAEGIEVELAHSAGATTLRAPVGGVYNAYNLAAAFALCRELGIEPQEIAEGLGEFGAAFGRLERVRFAQGKTALLLLVKNPTGFNEALRLVRDCGRGCHTVIALNDGIADGRDISWIWDVELEQLVGVPASVIASGTRAEDMALRLKYAGFDPREITIENDTRRALSMALERAAPGETVYVLPTYTAMTGLRRRLEREGLVGRFWEE